MANTIEGAIKRIGETKQVTEKFKKRELIIETPGQYPQIVSLEAQQDFCSELDKLTEGETITASIDIRGREWTDPKTNEIRVFNTVKVYKIESNF